MKKRSRPRRTNPAYVQRYRQMARDPHLRGYWDSIIQWQDEIAERDCVHWRGPRTIRIVRAGAYTTAGRRQAVPA